MGFVFMNAVILVLINLRCTGALNLIKSYLDKFKHISLCVLHNRCFYIDVQKSANENEISNRQRFFGVKGRIRSCGFHIYGWWVISV